MTVYIATDWFGTMVFDTKPKWIDNEWYGHRARFVEEILPEGFKQKEGEMVEAEIVLTIRK